MLFGFFSLGFSQSPSDIDVERDPVTGGIMARHKRAASSGASNNTDLASSVPNSTPSPSSTPVSSPVTTPTPTPSSTPNTSASDTGITSTPSSTTTTSKHDTTTTSKSTATPSSDIVTLGSTTIDRATLSSKSTLTQALVTSHTHTATFTSYWTDGGTTLSTLVTHDSVVKSTTGFATATLSPTLADGGGDGSNLSTHDKAIIGGLVGGVGGAVVLVGLGVVAFRLWGRKKRQAYQRGSYFESPADSIRHEKNPSNTMSATSDGLERYRRGPAISPPNTASNF